MISQTSWGDDWGKVIGSDWTMKEAALICGKLHCGAAVSMELRNDYTRSRWTISPDCVHSASDLAECAKREYSANFVEITCSGKQQLVKSSRAVMSSISVLLPLLQSVVSIGLRITS